MTHPFATLTPELVLNAVEQLGYESDARILTLNSYENRVYQVGIEDTEPLIAKFYRPDRWSDAAILEEHAFTLELSAHEIPVVPPLIQAGQTLFTHQGFRYALFARRGGRALEPDQPESLYRVGQLLGRLHAVGASKAFLHRQTVDVATLGYAAVRTVLESPQLPAALISSYQAVTQELLTLLEPLFAGVPYQPIRLHGDCHIGNLLCRAEQLYLVDLDDCRMGPAMQDFWMLLGDSKDPAQRRAITEIAEGYAQFYDFDWQQLRLLEGLRSLRLLQYSAWLAQRWDDPAFPLHFPWFGSQAYWQAHLQSVQVQSKLLEEGAGAVPWAEF